MVGDVEIVEGAQSIPVVVNLQKSRGDDDENQHPEAPDVTTPHDGELPSLIRVVVAGHSFIRHLREHLFVEKGPSFNMGLDTAIVNVIFMSRGGQTCQGMWSGFIQRIKNIRPHIVYLELGTIDAADINLTPNNIVNQMSAIARDLTQSGVQKVIFGQVLCREDRAIPRNIPMFNWKVVVINRLMAQVLSNLPNTQFWKHRGIWNSVYPILLDDGLHLTEIGNHRLFRSVRGAIIQAVPYIQP